jgi:nitrogen PTS system EIIA component
MVDIRTDNDEIMTLTEVARHLKVSEKTVLRMVQSGEFPGVKVSNQWRFVRTAMESWLAARMRADQEPSGAPAFVSPAPNVPLMRLVSNRRIVLDIEPGEKVDVLRQLVAPLHGDGLVEDVHGYVDRLLAREDLVSTAVGHGLAIPHLRNPGEIAFASPTIVIGICKSGTDFRSLDGKKTSVFAMPCAGTEAMHLHLLAKISLVFKNTQTLKRLTEAPTVKAIMEILAVTDHELGNQWH